VNVWELRVWLFLILAVGVSLTVAAKVILERIDMVYGELIQEAPGPVEAPKPQYHWKGRV
jgi:hypothetical protein